MKKLYRIVMIVLCILIMSTKVEAANPRVMVTDYKIKGESVVAGEDFELTIILTNEAANTVKNLKMTVNTENGELLPRQGAGTAYIKEIAAGSSEDITLSMKAAYGLEEKSYKVQIKTEYEGNNGVEYSVDESVFIPVTLSQRLSVTDVFFAQSEYEVGQTVELSGAVNNLGSGTLYNVTAKISGDNLSKAENYIGNIEPGKSGNIDIITKATVVTSGDHKKNYVVVCYEDKEGKQYENEVELDEIHVVATVYDDFEVIKEGKDYSHVIKSIICFVICIGVVVLIAWLWFKRRKKKMAMLDEF